MKILVVTQYFWPEEFRINDICKGLKEAGHDVEVLTGLPNYPEGKIYKGYSWFKKGVKEYNGIKIMRVPMIPRGKNSSMMLALNYVSFMVNASLKALTLIGKKYDRVFVFQVSPITSAVPAIILSKLKKIPSYIYIQDLWPETFYSIINIKNKKIRSKMKNICNKIYNSFDKLLIASKGYEDILLKEGFKKEKFEYFPQWAEDFYSESLKKVSENRIFTVTFAGNIGKAQSVNTIIEAANLAKENKNIKWQIIGDGSEFENIKYLVKKYSLENTVDLLGRKPAKDMPKYFSSSDGLIVTLKNEEILKVTLPAKVQSYMAAGKPIIAAISGEGSRTIKESKSGLVGEAEDYKALYENVIKLYDMNENERIRIGNNGKEFFKENFTRDKLLNQLEVIMS
ncbi:glycosyltransferase family 4 protein [Clostridium perfringens]|uniref:glycosyltransferase family 4 protein n=1 Tax=Clostridium perfringens TaxID=1502 RepID=UPI000D70E64D|nr:glycosyltransferase family 4 protein [Clostridium perfringens]MBX9100115.1 glycosyltransferase family 4 protein [Clostridium perfringens]MDK0760207.1 glycosyltransferase family 4 protein [Clostridium perfringens]PWW98574.1 glycosyltransferase WbuB [Clostridium perfringens]